MKKVVFLWVLTLVVFFPTRVWAQEASSAAVVSANPDSPFFGLQNAIGQVSQNLQLWLARSDEQKAALETKFAAQEQALMERIQNSENPEKFSELLTKLTARHEKRLSAVEARIEKVKEKREDVAERLRLNLSKLQTHREEIENKLEDLKDREATAGSQSAKLLQRRIEELARKTEMLNTKESLGATKAAQLLEKRREKLLRFQEKIGERVEERQLKLQQKQENGDVQGVQSGFWDVVIKVFGW